MSLKFFPLSVNKINTETPDTVSVSFDVPPSNKSDFVFKAGQYLTFKKTLNGEEVRRSYSICSSPNQGELTVAIKRIENGAFSSFATKDLKIGDVLEVMPPMGNFIVTPDASLKRNHVFFAAGSGITPILSMIKHLLEEEKNSTIHLFYVNKSSADTIFKNVLNQLAETHENLKLTYLYTRENSSNSLLNGRIDTNKCNALYATYLNTIQIDGIYACGPQEMIMNVKDYFLEKGIDPKNIHFELFTATATSKPVAESSNENISAQITVIMDDEPFKFQLSTNGKSILQAAQDAGADVPFSCKGGVCCTCKAKVMQGSAKMDLNYALDADEVEQGFILTCQAHPTSANVVVSFDEY